MFKETLKEIKKIKFPTFKTLVQKTVQTVFFILLFMGFFYACNMIVSLLFSLI